MRASQFLGLTFACGLFLSGCAGGPTHDYYNPAIGDAKYKGPVTMEHVDDVTGAKETLTSQGYAFVGSTDYSGKAPESKELTAQAKRAGANHVVYSTKWIPNPPGSWHFGFGNGFGGGGTGGGVFEVHILFFGK
jgi:hypothetical protein